jgi:hypothetical protein
LAGEEGFASFGGPPTSDNRPTPAPLGVPPSRGPIVAAVLVLVGVTFLVGFRLGGNGASPPVVVPSDGGNVSTSSTTPPPSTTAPLVQPDAVSSELASTAGGLVPPGWAICVVDTAPIVCRSIRPTAEPYDAFAGTAGITYFDLGALTPGQYLVAVIDQVPIPPPTRVAILTQVVGLLVCPGGLGNASPGCTSP